MYGQPPQSAAYPRPGLGPDRDALRAIAKAQRNVMLCVLAQLLGTGFRVAVLSIKSPELMLGVSLVFLVFALGILIFMIMSVSKLAGALGKSSVLYIILMFIPCVSLITLLMLSGQATKALQAQGVKVGILGADPNSI